MLAKLLDFEFNLNGIPIDTSGQGNHGQATATVFSVGPGDVRGAGFLSDQSRIVVQHNAGWNEITATRIDVRVRLDSLSRRANLVEIERSVALFVRQDGVVTFTFYAPADDEDSSGPQVGPPVFTARPRPTGSVDPFDTLVVTPPSSAPSLAFAWQGVNTDAQFAPDGQRRTLPLHQYVTISAIHDGLASMRIFIDGQLAGARYDVRYAVPPLVPPGVVAIGAWPHDGRYTLHGALDFVRIWRHDPHYTYRQFFCRPMSDEAKHCWHLLLRQINGNLDDATRADGLMELVRCLDGAYRALYRAIASTGDDGLRNLQRFHREYVRLWCAGRIDGYEMRDLQQRFVKWIRGAGGEEYDRHFADIRACMEQRHCLDIDAGIDLRKCDQAWAGFVELMAGVLADAGHDDARVSG